MNPIFSAVVKKGKLILADKGRFDEYLLTLEGVVQVIVEKPKKRRSNPQNRYYRGVVVKILSEHTGYNENEMHSALGLLFLQDHSGPIPTIRSTASLTTLEFEEYLTKIRTWGDQELSCFVPLPNEVEY